MQKTLNLQFYATCTKEVLTHVQVFVCNNLFSKLYKLVNEKILLLCGKHKNCENKVQFSKFVEFRYPFFFSIFRIRQMEITTLTPLIKTLQQLQLGPRPKVLKTTVMKSPFQNGRFRLLTKNLQMKQKSKRCKWLTWR